MDSISTGFSEQSVSTPAFILNDDKLNRYKDAAQYENISDEDAERYLRLIWEIACAVTAIQCGIDPVQSALGIRSVSSRTADESAV